MSPKFIGKRTLYLPEENLFSNDADNSYLELLSGSPSDSSESSAESSNIFHRDIRYTPRFVGRRSSPMSYTRDYRWAPKFVGKRGRSPYYVGKRPNQEEKSLSQLFLEKRFMKPKFIGRRSSGHPILVGRREPSADLDSAIFLGKRSVENNNKLPVKSIGYLVSRTRRKRSINTPKSRHKQTGFYINKTRDKLKQTFLPDHQEQSSEPIVNQSLNMTTAKHNTQMKEADHMRKTKTTRAWGLDNVSKRSKLLGSVLLEKRESWYPDYIGKRSKSLGSDLFKTRVLQDKSFLGKRSESWNPDFLGKRSESWNPDFLGKRSITWNPNSLVKRSKYLKPYIFGKRRESWYPDFLGKRSESWNPDFLGKRSESWNPDFLSKRSESWNPDFLGKRRDSWNPDFLGKRTQSWNPDFLGKRSESWSPDFLSKRSKTLKPYIRHDYLSPDFLNRRSETWRADLVGKHESLTPGYVDKRSNTLGSDLQENYEGQAPDSVDSESWNPVFLPKRSDAWAPDFLGKRSKNIPYYLRKHMKISSRKRDDSWAPDFLGKRSSIPVYSRRYTKIQPPVLKSPVKSTITSSDISEANRSTPLHIHRINKRSASWTPDYIGKRDQSKSDIVDAFRQYQNNVFLPETPDNIRLKRGQSLNNKQTQIYTTELIQLLHDRQSWLFDDLSKRQDSSWTPDFVGKRSNELSLPLENIVQQTERNSNILPDEKRYILPFVSWYVSNGKMTKKPLSFANKIIETQPELDQILTMSKIPIGVNVNSNPLKTSKNIDFSDIFVNANLRRNDLLRNYITSQYVGKELPARTSDAIVDIASAKTQPYLESAYKLPTYKASGLAILVTLNKPLPYTTTHNSLDRIQSRIPMAKNEYPVHHVKETPILNYGQLTPLPTWDINGINGIYLDDQAPKSDYHANKQGRSHDTSTFREM